jgi:cell division protein FtsI (penicillin-binding protein 3)
VLNKTYFRNSNFRTRKTPFWNKGVVQALFLWEYTSQIFAKRLLYAMGIYLFLIVIVVIRLVFLACSEDPKPLYTNKLNVFRKEILDRNGTQLAVNLPIMHLFAHPKHIINAKKVTKILCESIEGLDYNKTLAKLSSQKNFVWIKKSLSPLEQSKVQKLPIEGIALESIEKRFYPYEDLLSHVIGYTSMDNIGLAGLERGLEDMIIDQKDNKPIKLSIDLRLQAIAREEIINAQNKFQAKGGGILVADVNTGEILCYFSTPSFNPHKIDFKDEHALMNHNALSVFEIGSVMKPIIMAIALDTKQISLTDIYDVTHLKIGKYTINDFYNYNGYYSTAQVLANSSNKGMVQIGLRVGKEKIANYMSELNLFTDLKHIQIPEKAKPLFPDMKKWNNLTTAIMSYGYGLSISPLHYLQAIIPVVNGGKFVPITLLKQNKPSYIKQVFSSETSDKMRILLRLVVANGTGKRMDVKGIEVGGKTGTANKTVGISYSKHKRISSIFATFPIENPKYVIYGFLDEPVGIKETGGYATAGVTIAPFVKNVILKMIALYGAKPSKENIKTRFQYLLYPPPIWPQRNAI